VSEGWLQALAWADEQELCEAAALVVENGVTVTAEDWRSLSTSERAALTMAQRAHTAALLAMQGREVDGARLYAEVDGGVAAARTMAELATHGVAEGLKAKRAQAGG